MEIYKPINSPASKEFEKLLNTEFSKKKNISEGKIIEGTITKVTSKYCFIECGLKSEAALDISELKVIGFDENNVVNQKIRVLLERVESRDGEVVVSAIKASKIEGYQKLVKKFENNEPIFGRVLSRVKGGVIFEEKTTKVLTFMPGSQLATRPIKDISSLLNTEFKALIIKWDYERGNICTSRRAVLENNSKESKLAIISKYKEGDIIEGTVKSITSFGVFFDIQGELDVLAHTSELSYSRVSSPNDLFSVNEKHKLKIIGISLTDMRISVSIKKCGPDPFDNISKYEMGGKIYKAKVIKIVQFGIFMELEDGLIGLCHSSEIDWLKKNPSPEKFCKVNDIIPVCIKEIDQDGRKISLSHKMCIENPYVTFEKKFKVGDIVDSTIYSSNDYSIFVKFDGLDVLGFNHQNDLSYHGNPEDQLKLFAKKKNEKIKVKIQEIKPSEMKIRVSHKLTTVDPMKFFENKKVNDVITVKVISTADSKGIIVRPHGVEANFLIKKGQTGQQESRFVGGESIDVAIAELDLSPSKRKVVLSIKLLENIEKQIALDKYGVDSGSGKQLPFSSLQDQLKRKKKTKE